MFEIEHIFRGQNDPAAKVEAVHIHDQVQRILKSELFENSTVLAKLLEAIIKEAETGASPKAAVLYEEVFNNRKDQGALFTPRPSPSLDSRIRVEALRLRQKLLEYYAGPGRNDPVVITIPKGAYRPVFEYRPAPQWSMSPDGCILPEPSQSFDPGTGKLEMHDNSFVQQNRSSPISKRLSIVLIVLPLLLVAVAIIWVQIANWTKATPLRVSEYIQLTHSGHAGYVAGTDGSRVYLTSLYPFSIDEVAVSGGDVEAVRGVTVPNPFLFNVSPDGSTFLVQSWAVTPSSPLYAVRSVDGTHRYLADTTPASGTWSPDGKLVAYTTPHGDLNVVNSDATSAHKLASVGGGAYPLSWSPDGSVIRFSRDLESLWEITSSGSNLHQVFPAWHSSEQKCCGRWSPDGRFFVFLVGALGPGKFPNAQIYAGEERRELFRQSVKDPFQLTSGPVEWGPPVFSKDGKKIFATGTTTRGELARLDMKSGQFKPFLGGISADFVSFSKDGQFVAYVTYPDGILWRAKQDGSDRVQLTSSILRPQSVSWSPDGRQLVFDAPSPQGPHIWIVSSTDGIPHRLIPNDSGSENHPDWSPDGRTILFATGEFGGHNSHIRTLDVASRQTKDLPGSEGKIGPRWSPDGQFINASSLDVSTNYIFDLQTQHWSALNIGIHAFAQWSSDGRSVYFMRYATDPAILSIPATGGEAKLVVSLKDFPSTGTFGLWFGLDPSDAPLILRDASTTDVYALTLEEK